MNKKLKPTLSVGVPAYNEEGNIAQNIRSILSQNRKLYELEKIYVICDACTDDTVEIVQQLQKEFNLIELHVGKIRSGKIAALEKIYSLNRSDYILAIDADTVFATKSSIDALISVITKDKRINFVGPRHVPVKPNTIMGMFAYYSYLSFEEAFLKINNGNNCYGVMGAYLLRKDFAKSIKYPNGVFADQTLLYGFATQNNYFGFKLVKKAKLLFRTVTTFNDWRVLGVRSVYGDKNNAVKVFGKEILKKYSMPRLLLIKSLIKWFIKNPFYLTGSILMNYYIRKYPLNRVIINGAGWETTKSSKQEIGINYV